MSTKSKSSKITIADPETTQRTPDVQLLYNALGLSRDDQHVYDNFRNELQQRLKTAYEDELKQDASGAMSSGGNASPIAPRSAVQLSDKYGGNTEEDYTEEEDDAEQAPPAEGSPGPDSWAARKPTDRGVMHFPGHANYSENEIPVTGSHGFMLLHRRPRFVPDGRYITSHDGQPLDQLAMCTLHYIDNAELHVQRESYLHSQSIDFTSRNDVRRVAYWARKFYEQHGVRKLRRDQVPYIDEERAWIRDLFEREPKLALNQLAPRYNRHWDGRVVDGVKRPRRTPGGLINEVYRSNLKNKGSVAPSTGQGDREGLAQVNLREGSEEDAGGEVVSDF